MAYFQIPCSITIGGCLFALIEYFMLFEFQGIKFLIEEA